MTKAKKMRITRDLLFPLRLVAYSDEDESHSRMLSRGVMCSNLFLKCLLCLLCWHRM